jgi:hypothetical protein
MTDGWPGVEFTPPRNGSRYNGVDFAPSGAELDPQINEAERTLDGLSDVISAEDLARRKATLALVKELRQEQRRAGHLDGLIRMGLQEVLEGLDNPQRTIASYQVVDHARGIIAMAEQLTNAEAMFESDISTPELQYVVKELEKIKMDLELGSPFGLTA